MMGVHLFKRLQRSSLAIVVGICTTMAAIGAERPPEDYTGSFRLATGEVISGGYLFEDGQGQYIYFLDGMENPAMFHREGNTVFESVRPPGIRLRFQNSSPTSAVR